MPILIAEINEKIPNAYKNQLLLNEDKKIYLYNPNDRSSRVIDDNSLLKMEDVGCLNWANEQTRTAIVNLVENNIRLASRNYERVEIQHDAVISHEEVEKESKTKQKILLLSMGAINILFLIIIGISIYFNMQPLAKYTPPNETELHTVLVAENISKNTTPLSYTENIFATQKENIFYPVLANLNGISYKDNVLIWGNRNKAPLYMGTATFQSGSDFRQTVPVTIYKSNGEETGDALFIDNRFHKDIFIPFITNIFTRQETILYEYNDKKGISDVGTYNAKEAVGGGDCIFISLVKNQDTPNQTMEMMFFNNSNKSYALWNTPINTTKNIENLKVYNDYLVFKRTSMDGEKTIMFGKFTIIDNTISFIDGGLKDITTLHPNINANDLDIIDFYQNKLLLKDNTGNISIADITRSSISEVPVTETNPVVNSTETSATALKSSETSSTPFIKFDKEYNKDALPILHTNYYGQTFIVIVDSKNNILLYDINNLSKEPLIVKKIGKDKIYKLLSLRGRIYWLEGTPESSKNDIYSFYMGIPLPTK